MDTSRRPPSKRNEGEHLPPGGPGRVRIEPHAPRAEGVPVGGSPPALPREAVPRGRRRVWRPSPRHRPHWALNCPGSAYRCLGRNDSGHGGGDVAWWATNAPLMRSTVVRPAKSWPGRPREGRQCTRGPPMQARSAVRAWPGVAPRITPGGPNVLAHRRQELRPNRPACPGTPTSGTPSRPPGCTGTCSPPTTESARARHPWSCRNHRRRDARPRSTDPPTPRSGPPDQAPIRTPCALITSPCGSRSAAPAADPRSPAARSRSPCRPRQGWCPPGSVSARRRG